jgi:uncharacterized membrane protein YjfL (UPF0719 family)
MEYVDGALASLAWAAVGVVLMALGFGLVDVLTPGKLGELIWRQRNPNAAIVLSSGLLGIAVIVVVAIITSHDSLVAGLVSTSVYGVVGLVLLGLSFVLLDAITPGKLGEILTEPVLHPAAWVTATVHLAVSAIIAAAIS